MNILSPSILAIDLGHIERDLLEASGAGADTFHLDIMDGMFVPNISFGPDMISCVRKALPDAFLDVHMMVKDPIRYLDKVIEAGGNLVTIHYEATYDIKRDLAIIREKGVKVGVAISPDTPVSVLEDLIDKVDMVLVMSVYPGLGGQVILPASFERVKAVKQMIQEKGLKVDVEVDGGVTRDNVKSILDAGANVIVSGSAVFGKDISESVKDFLKILGENDR